MTKADLEIHIGRLLIHPGTQNDAKTNREDFAALVQKAIGERLANVETSRPAGSGPARIVADGILNLPSVAAHLTNTKRRAGQ